MPDDAPSLTPMMQQLQAARAQHPGMMVFFQNGEFYELFGTDAVHGSKLLGLTLTKREETPMAGFPLSKLEHYLRMLLAAGERVAVVEQMEQPSTAGKKIIRREVTRVVTLGTVTDEEFLDPKQANHLAAIVRGRGDRVGLAWVDLSTGLFFAADLDAATLADDYDKLSIAECLVPESHGSDLLTTTRQKSITVRPDWTFDAVSSVDALKQQFQVLTMAGFGFDDSQACLTAAGAIVIYLRETLKSSLLHLQRLQPHQPEKFLALDEVTRRSLELTRTLRENSREGSLLSVLDRCVTPMGARLLGEWLLTPLAERLPIEARLDAVGELCTQTSLRSDLRELLQLTADLQRLATRTATARATPRDLVAIARTLRQLPAFKAKISHRKASLLNELEARVELFADLRDTLDQALVDEAPLGAKDGGIIRDGYSNELDELKRLTLDGKSWIARYQAQEITRSGIHSLKVGYTHVIGYYIEITNSHESKVPANYMHERTLKNCKRYVTPELKEYEEKVLTAEEKSKALEFELFLALRDAVGTQTPQLLAAAEVLATIDVLASFAELAVSRNYVRPTIRDEAVLDIREGRHPVLDCILPAGTLVPNDVTFSADDGQFWLITGPNMSGKSTFIRQVALLTLLAHIGCFVPAAQATVGLTDRIFTRVGASDELGRGQSTFMVEMTEAANILNNATEKSLVILDEIGRGTSTYDGVSLAWAITEHLHDVTACRALFATHYHELAQLSEVLPRLRNHTVRVVEDKGEVIFLHKIASGSADKSYGIHVARLAGLPETILARAEAVLASLESPHQTPVQESSRRPRLKKARPQIQSLFGSD